MTIYHVAAIGITASALSLTLKKDNPVFGIFISITASVLIFMMALPGLSGVIELVSGLAESIDTDIPFIAPVLKIIGIAYISEFASQIVSDAGESAIASKIEFAGKILIITVSAPIIIALVNQVGYLLA